MPTTESTQYTLQERLLRAVAVNSETGCWEWQRAKNQHGYGRVGQDGKNRFAHRVSYEAFVGPIPDGLNVCHRCNNKGCVNPEHLYAASQRQNIIDAWRDGLKERTREKSRESFAAKVNERRTRTHCTHGHEYTAENTYLYRGYRHCRACRAAFCTNRRKTK